MRYTEKLLDHFRNPRNAGLMRDPDAEGEGEYPECMDMVRIHLRVREGRVGEARFQAYGCGPTIAAASAGTELIGGMPLEDLVGLDTGRVEAALGGLPDDRRHAAWVVATALRAAARDALGRAGRAPGKT